MNLLDKVGGLSKTKKMPGYSWGIPASLCKTGSQLAQNPNSVCHQCYAKAGRYPLPSTQKKLWDKWNAYRSNPTWREDMVSVLGTLVKDDIPYFRWFDSGDLQSPKMLETIVWIAEQLPDIHFYLPTKEYRIVKEFLETRTFPKNLVVRPCSPNIDQPPLRFPHTSTVVTENPTCPADSQGHRCLDCRACWDPGVKNVAYHFKRTKRL